MTLILAAQFPDNRYLIALSLPRYQPSILLGVIIALALAVAGLAVDVVLFPAAIGTISLWLATIATGIALGLIPLEVMRR
jgi:hypothetical protein